MGRTLIGFALGVLIVPAIGAAVVLSGRFPFQATEPPPRWEGWIAGMALDPAVARKAEGLTNPVASTDAELMRGMKLYRDDCAGCHGGPGQPSRWGQHNFYPPAPPLAEHGLDDPVPGTFVVLKYGIRYTGMAGWKDQLPDDDLWRVAMFLNRVESLPPNVGSAWKGEAPADSGGPASADSR
jgi:thiosulfate dehydrogenase